MMVTLAGAMSTAELGLSLAEMIRRGKVGAIVCTGANLEEDIFNLVAHDYYERVPHYRAKFDAAGVHPDDCRSLADLAKFPFTTKADLRDNYPFGMFAVPRERVVRVQGSLQSNSSEVIRAAVLAGRGIGYSPDWLFEAELASGELVTLMPDWQTPPLPMHLISPAQRQHSAKVRAFGEFVREALNRRP